MSTETQMYELDTPKMYQLNGRCMAATGNGTISIQVASICIKLGNMADRIQKMELKNKLVVTEQMANNYAEIVQVYSDLLDGKITDQEAKSFCKTMSEKIKSQNPKPQNHG